MLKKTVNVYINEAAEASYHNKETSSKLDFTIIMQFYHAFEMHYFGLRLIQNNFL